MLFQTYHRWRRWPLSNNTKHNTGKLIKHTAVNKYGGNKEYNMGTKQKIHAEANAMLSMLAGHMMNHNMVVAAAEGGRYHVVRGGRRLPTSCGPLVFSAFASACICCFCPILYFLRLAHLVLYFWTDWGQKTIVFSFHVAEWAPNSHVRHVQPEVTKSWQVRALHEPWQDRPNNWSGN